MVPTSRLHGASFGFTLIEVLVSISIIGVLLSFVFPVFLSIRETARLVTVQIHQRDVALVLRQYAYDHRDLFPFYGQPRSLNASLVVGGYYSVTEGYWLQPHYWGAYVADMGYDGYLSMVSPPYYDPPIDERDPLRPRYAYRSSDVLTYGAFASPAYWADLGSQSISLHLPQRWNTIRFPSYKGVLIRDARREPGGGFFTNTEVMVAFGDGHVEPFVYSDLLPPIGMVLGDSVGISVLTTPDGLLGRDR